MYLIKTERSNNMKTMELQGEQLELFNEIIQLDNESIEKVKKYIKRMVSGKYKIARSAPIDDIDVVTDEEIENAMRPLTHEEKMERLRVAEEDQVYYTHEEVKQMSAKWIK